MSTFSTIRQRLGAAIAHRRTRRAAVWLIGLVALYALLGFFVLPWFAKPRIEQALGEALMRPVSIERLYTNPFSLSARIDNLQVRDADGGEAIAGIGEAYANVSSTSLFRLAPVIDRLRIREPFIKLVRHEDRQYNVQDVVDRYVWQQPEAPEPEDKTPPRFSLNNIELIDGRISFDDQLEGKRHEVRELQIGVPFLSSLPYATEIYVQPNLSAVVNGAPLAVSGETKPFGEDRETLLYINFDNVQLPQYFDYVPVPLRFALAKGALDARLTLRMAGAPGSMTTLSLTGTATARDVDVRQRDDEPMIAFESLAVELRELDLIGNRLSLAAVRAASPQVHVTRFRGGMLNLELLMPLETGTAQKPAAASAESKPAQPFRYAVDEVAIANGRVQLLDYDAPQPFRTAFTDIALNAKNIGNDPEQQGTYDVSLRLTDKGQFTTQGQLALAPVAVNGSFKLADLALPHFQPYLGPERQLGSGTLSGEGAYRVAMKDGAAPDIVVEGLKATVRDSRVHTAIGKDRWRAGQIDVSGVRIDVGKRNVSVDEVSTRDVAATVLRTANGDWYVTGLLHVAAETAEAAEQAQKNPSAADDGPAWTYQVRRIGLEASSLQYEDRATKQPVKLQAHNINGVLSGLSSAPDAEPQLALNATIQKAGKLSLGGPMKLAPFGFDWKVSAQAIPVLPFSPYWTEQISLDITRGAIAARGRLRLGEDRRGQTALRFGGRIDVNDFSAREGGSRRDLLRWKRLRLQDVYLRTEPVLVRVGAIALNDSFARIILLPDGTLNLQHVLAAPSDAKDEAAQQTVPGETVAANEATASDDAATADDTAAPEETAAPKPAIERRGKPRIEIGEVRLANGELDFSDRYIKPNYRAEIGKLEGSIGALSPEQAGRIELTGTIDDIAPVTISGLINPLGQSLFLDIDASAKGVNLPPLSPYSVRYIGYPIERGKLSMDVKYHIENDQLTAQNKLVLNQLVFGEKVESPEALNVPVHLAVSLLKDSNGVIDLDVPISGSLNDPQFSIGGVIAKAIGNLFIKVVTSPFTALGAMFGGDGERMSFIAFEPGSAELSEAAQQRLSRLARAMRNRPGLTLDVAGRVDPQAEEDALRRESMMRRLRTAKLKALTEELDNPPRLEEVEIEPEEYEKYLKAAYDAGRFDKPRNFLGFAKRLPPAEMEKLLLANTPVNENAMRRLANRRAEAVVTWLREQGQVPPERVYVAAPKLDAKGVTGDGATTRVDFTVRR